MCGVFGYIGKDIPDISGFILDGLSKLEYRGYDSSGIAFLDKKRLKIIKAVGPLVNLKSKVGKRRYKGFLGIGHTRWATHGGVTVANSHPQTDCNKKIAVVHNGIIENYEILRKDLRKKGHNFVSETDTEVFPHLVEEILKNRKVSFKEAVFYTFKLCKGLNAVVAVSSQGQIVGCRMGSPLVAGIGKDCSYISSDIPGLSEFTKNFILLDDGDAVVIEEDKITLFDLKSQKEKVVKPRLIDFKEKAGAKGKYTHFLLKEIHEQAEVVAHVADNKVSEIKSIANEIKNAYGTYFSACGTAAYAGMAATYMFSEIAKRHINFTIASEFPYYEDFLVEKSLLIAASQSGETMDTLEAVRAAKRHKSKVLAIVNVAESSLERMADFTLHLNAGREQAVLATKSYTAKLATFLILSYAMAGKYQEGAKIIKDTAGKIEKMFSEGIDKKVLKLAGKLTTSKDIYLIGRGINYPTALEGALKIKEASYIHAEGFPGGELKHGTLALIERDTPCIVIASNDRAKNEIISNAMEISARGAYIIGIAPQKEKVFDEWIKVPDLQSASAILSVIPLQLLGYYLAVALGRDPDKPRNLAKSVTVK